jgi:hypothetical protein
MQDGESHDLMPEDALHVLERTVHTLHQHVADTLHLSARVEGLELMVVALAAKLGWPPEPALATLRRVQNTHYQKRLERVEDLSPAAAAAADSRRVMPEIDEIMLDILKYDGGGLE